MDDAIRWLPDAPYLHVALAVRTAQRGPPRALLVALAVRHRRNDFDRPLDETLPRSQSLLNHVFNLCKGLGRLHPIIAYPLEAFGKRMLHHTADKRIDVDPFLLDPLAFMRTVVIRDTVAIIAVDPPQGERWTDDIGGQIPR